MTEMCQWWVLCDHEATGTRSHPILGDVPICDRCASKVARIEQRKRVNAIEGEGFFPDEPDVLEPR